MDWWLSGYCAFRFGASWGTERNLSKAGAFSHQSTIITRRIAMSSPQSRTGSVVTDPLVIEEITTTLYVDSATLKVLSQETTLHPADGDNAAHQVPSY